MAPTLQRTTKLWVRKPLQRQHHRVLVTNSFINSNSEPVRLREELPTVTVGTIRVTALVYGVAPFIGSPCSRWFIGDSCEILARFPREPWETRRRGRVRVLVLLSLSDESLDTAD